MSITAIVANGLIKLPVPVPDGTRVQVTVPQTDESRKDATLYEALEEIIGQAEGLPPDFAAQHDHYLHGTPKRADG
jgi:hypothetical protein